MTSKNSSNKIIVIAGPTATGKSQLAIEVARKYSAEIINFDSLLFYKELNIGTAKPNKKELELIPHHLVNIETIQLPINVSDFFKRAMPIIHEIHKKNKPVILAGGSGFYLQALLHGVYDAPSVNQAIIKKSDALYKEKGIAPFLEVLKENDQDSFNRYHQNDHYRIRRAVEHYWQDRTPFSSARKNKEKSEKDYPKNKFNWNLHQIYLDMPKDSHFKIIQKRTSKMIEQGLIAEVQNLLASFKGSEKPLNSIGYKETQEYLNGLIPSINELEEKISIATRQLAKSQRTWFNKRMPHKTVNYLEEKEEINRLIDLFIKS